MEMERRIGDILRKHMAMENYLDRFSVNFSIQCYGQMKIYVIMSLNYFSSRHRPQFDDIFYFDKKIRIGNNTETM